METKWAVTFTAGKTSRTFEMLGTRLQAVAWAKRERHYFAAGRVARYKVVSA